jgi:acetoin utilization deacetylase AcuC-like enzyme
MRVAKLLMHWLGLQGHHAQPTQADGYCFLNNAGLAVQLALDSGCQKVVVIDIDVHYGNGTAEGFYRSNKVLTISLHMNHGSWGPSHPQNGSVDELGEGEGFGYNMNIPLPNGTGDKGYVYAMTELVLPAIEKFGPDMIVLVVGQDSSAVSSSKYLGKTYQKPLRTFTCFDMTFQSSKTLNFTYRTSNLTSHVLILRHF